MALRAVRYLRVSRQDQDPRLQDDETKEFITRRGWKLADTYTDQGVSGAKDRRPELDRLLGDARRKKFDVLLVWRSDRMFRSLKNMVNTLDDLTSLGIAFTSVTEHRGRVMKLPFPMRVKLDENVPHVVLLATPPST